MRLIKSIIIVTLILFLYPFISNAENDTLQRFYLDAKFHKIVEILEKKNDQTMELNEKLLLIECLSRTSKGTDAYSKLEPLLTANPSNPEILTAAGIVYMSLGNLNKAKESLVLSSTINPNSWKTALSMIMLDLNSREFTEAKRWYETLLSLETNNRWTDSVLVFLVGTEVYKASGDSTMLAKLYKTRASRKEKYDSAYRSEMKAEYKMYNSAGKGKIEWFQVEGGPDRIAIPFTPGDKTLRVNTISMTVKGKTFNVILDTGNTAGWVTHNRELNERLDPKKGSRTVTGFSPNADMMDGYSQYYKTIDFNGFKIHNVYGIYIPKPHPDFPDANLNPAFIRNRIVTLDFVKKELVLQTKKQNSNEHVSRIPWYGYKYVFVPIEVKGKQGLGIIETGAENIAFRFDYINGLQLPLIPKTRYLANGKIFQYHQTQTTLHIGGIPFQRDSAEVWPFENFSDPLTGLTPDAIIGPDTFRDRFTISFDPIDKQIIIEQVDRFIPSP